MENYINEQNRKGEPNNLVQCIWYCITGTRFEEVEINLLNSLRKVYDNNKIPIIIIYTQATDEDNIKKMKDYIKIKNINANFIAVLAERKKLVNQIYLPSFGLHDLIKQTLEQCKIAFKGDMRAVMRENISKNIFEILKNENAYIMDFIYEKIITDFTSYYNFVKNDNDFINYIIDIFGSNIKYYLNKNMSKNSYNYFKSTNLIKEQTQKFIDSYKEIINNIIKSQIMPYSIKFLDRQAYVEKTEKKNIEFRNKRCLNDFKETSKKFVLDNMYYVSQQIYIYFIITKFLKLYSGYCMANLNQISKQQLETNDIKNLIDQTFLKKFNEFEIRVNYLLENNKKNNNIDFTIGDSSPSYSQNKYDITNYPSP